MLRKLVIENENDNENENEIDLCRTIKTAQRLFRIPRHQSPINLSDYPIWLPSGITCAEQSLEGTTINDLPDPLAQISPVQSLFILRKFLRTVYAFFYGLLYPYRKTGQMMYKKKHGVLVHINL